MKSTSRPARIAGAMLILCSLFPVPPRSQAAPAGKRIVITEKQLESLSRALKQPEPVSAYTQLSAIALQKSSGVLGTRAALALGYFDYGKGNYALAAKWLARAKSDPLLADYADYWAAETELALGHSAEALAQLKQFRADHPDSVMTQQALQSLGDAALAAGQPAEAVAALDAYAGTPQSPELLFLRGQAHEKAGQPLDAVADYQAVYMRFATSEQSHEAATRLAFLHSSLGADFPALPLDQRTAHAAALFAAKDWADARNEYVELLPALSGADRERAELRVLECGVALGAGPSDMAALPVADPDVDAERYEALAEFYRNQQQEPQMVAAVEAVASRAPLSHWTDSALFLAGNYYWVQLDRDHAAAYYKRLVQNFPASPNADAAQWRVAWASVLKRQPDAVQLMQDHLRLYPGSLFTPDALYWLGRLAEEAGDSPLARGYYTKLADRYPQNYFESLAAARLRNLGPAPVDDPDVLASIRPVSPIPKLEGPIPPAAGGRQARADALRSIAFDTSAELELRAGYAATGAPRLLLEAAQSAVAAAHYGEAIVTIRQIFPQLESQHFSDVPREVWLIAYALPFEASIRRWSARAGVDPMLVAGLIHQESAFEPDARSGKNAIGLMQLVSQTARLLARQEKVGYSQARLVDPDYNIRLGTLYFANLRKQFGGVESALAAYNAGEDRVTLWTAGQTYRDTPEYVDSIPFTETRQYVEIVTRNADIYRRLYGEPTHIEHRPPAKKRSHRP
ncbi:MAG TPA: transglycosylase SLT domain-containing protein [Candidatus Acidoferrales bacterium]|nr:transglycosylase SLT domain-containing protein [Candidatus Acidoferrales bacterium]